MKKKVVEVCDFPLLLFVVTQKSITNGFLFF